MFSVQPIAFVHNERKEIKDDEWGEVKSYITLTELYTEESIQGIEDFLILKLFFIFIK